MYSARRKALEVYIFLTNMPLIPRTYVTYVLVVPVLTGLIKFNRKIERITRYA